MFLSTTSVQLFNTSSDGHSNASLSCLFQCLTTFSMKKYFLMFNLNLPSTSWGHFPLFYHMLLREKRLTPIPPMFKQIQQEESSQKPGPTLGFEKISQTKEKHQNKWSHHKNLSSSTTLKSRSLRPDRKSIPWPWCLLQSRRGSREMEPKGK